MELLVVVLTGLMVALVVVGLLLLLLGLLVVGGGLLELEGLFLLLCLLLNSFELTVPKSLRMPKMSSSSSTSFKGFRLLAA